MKNLIFIDVEASGLAVDSYPIEVAIRLNDTTYSWIIKPQHGWTHWCDTAESLHGLSREFIIHNGLAANDVAEEINHLLTDTDGLVYSDAALWDSGWMATLFRSANTSPKFYILPIQDLLNDRGQRKFFENLEHLFEEDSRQRHRAGTDVEIIEQAYMLAEPLCVS